jgi:hypothetical protein
VRRADPGRAAQGDARRALCVPCQDALDQEEAGGAGYNRRGSKDSQLR